MTIRNPFRSRTTRPDPEPSSPPLNLVVGLNRVDQMVPGGWNTTINLPTDAAAMQIDRKCRDIIRLLSEGCGIGATHVEFYSALKRYRLEQLLTRVITHCVAGFKIDADPQHFEKVPGVSPEARAFAEQERERRRGRAASPLGRSQRDDLFADLSAVLSADELRTLKERFAAEVSTPARLAVIGQSGVGKTTTVNALFSVDWRTSAVDVGTHEPQSQVVPLPSGSSISVTDLPGYGRSVSEDAAYESMYRDQVTDCDLVLLIVQADRGDFADDQEMIMKIKEWRAAATPPTRISKGDQNG